VRLLLDSHAVLWYFHDPAKLSEKAGTAIDSEENQTFISSASFWEIAIKSGLGKLRLSRSLSEIRTDFVNHGALILDVTSDHAIGVEHLAHHLATPSIVSSRCRLCWKT
jgi:PIN domain nuclease of toxin-antitoxin system